jgi:addiction module HigA family antidote
VSGWLHTLSLMEVIMTRMHNPAHPGEVLREYLPQGMTVGEAAKRLGVTRQAFSALLNGRSGVSAKMALRLSAALGTSAEMWINMQAANDLREAEQKPRRPPRSSSGAKRRNIRCPS